MSAEQLLKDANKAADMLADYVRQLTNQGYKVKVDGLRFMYPARNPEYKPIPRMRHQIPTVRAWEEIGVSGIFTDVPQSKPRGPYPILFVAANKDDAVQSGLMDLADRYDVVIMTQCNLTEVLSKRYSAIFVTQCVRSSADLGQEGQLADLLTKCLDLPSHKKVMTFYPATI